MKRIEEEMEDLKLYIENYHRAATFTLTLYWLKQIAEKTNKLNMLIREVLEL